MGRGCRERLVKTAWEGDSRYLQRMGVPLKTMQQKVGAMAKVGGVGAGSDLRSCSAYDAGPSGLGIWSKTLVMDRKSVKKPTLIYDFVRIRFSGKQRGR